MPYLCVCWSLFLLNRYLIFRSKAPLQETLSVCLDTIRFQYITKASYYDSLPFLGNGQFYYYNDSFPFLGNEPPSPPLLWTMIVIK